MPKTKAKERKSLAPSVRTVAGALIALREVMKKDHGLDVDVEVNIHYWPMTIRIARLATEDMLSGYESWKTGYRVASGSFNDERDLHFCYMEGHGLNKGLGVTIFKRDGEKTSKRMTALPRAVKKYSKAAYAVNWIRSLIRELYGVDADVKVKAEVKISEYYFISSINQNVTKDSAVEILNAVKVGTDWTISDEEKRYTPSFGRHKFNLTGKNVEFEIHFDLPKLD